MTQPSQSGPFRLPRLIGSIRNRHLLAVDIVALVLGAMLAFALRLDTSVLQMYLRTMLIYAAAAPVVKIAIFAALGVYSRFWQFASVDELVLLSAAAVGGSLLQGALFLGGQALFPELLLPGVPRSIPLIDMLLTGVVIAAPRFSLRLGAASARRAGKAHDMGAGPVEHVLIAGAGEAGAMVLRELRANPQTGLQPVGFVDDDPSKRGMLINRLRVLGDRAAIPELVRLHHVEQVIIAMPSASGQGIRAFVETGEAAGVRVRIIPGIYELLDGTVSINQLRDVQIDDLLRREPVRTDTASVADLLRGRRVLVTGAGGSIGAELCRQIVRCRPASLVLLGHGENSIFDVHNELSNPRGAGTGSDGHAPQISTAVTPVIADIRFADRLQSVLDQVRPEIVFHAAAHKHVPLMEDNAADAVSTNVVGTQRLVEACLAAGVAHFVLISTDKAVNPTSVMGATKRLAELIVQDAARTSGRGYVAVRFGNVLGSRGSVVPYFRKQIAEGGPVTVTHPDVKRYFMTIPEAVQLVLQAATLGHGGEIFVLDMGEPVRIVDLARDLIRLSGFEPEREIAIRFTGLRPGEKLFEELFGDREKFGRTRHEKVLVSTNGCGGDGVEAHALGHQKLVQAIDALAEAASAGDAAAVRRQLAALVPEYDSQVRTQ